MVDAKLKQQLTYILRVISALDPVTINALRADVDDLQGEIASMDEIVSMLASLGKVFGANIYIMPNTPESPNPGDIWYNTNAIRTVT